MAKSNHVAKVVERGRVAAGGGSLWSVHPRRVASSGVAHAATAGGAPAPRAAGTRIDFVRRVGVDHSRKEDEMHTGDPMTTPFGSRTRQSHWIARVVAVAAVAAMIACASQGPPPSEPKLTPALVGEKTLVTHDVAIRPAGGACTVDPEVLQDVDIGELVRFANGLSGQPVQLFDLPAELFGTTSLTVPPGSSVSLQVATQAKRGASYQYSVSCLPSTEARPRIVIRTSDQ